MSDSAEPLPTMPQHNEGVPSPGQVKKARMLVSMLGADFAKTSAHPFFKDLARTAVQPLDRKAAPPDMSKALATLVRRLAEPHRPRETRRNIKVQESTVSVEPEASAIGEPDIMAQHPALIAKHLIDLPTALQLDALRKLRGQTARQVAAYVAELKK